MCVWQYGVQQALLSHTASSTHLLKLLWPICCHLYLYGMACNSCSERQMDGLLSHLLTKQSHGGSRHLSGREGYGLELQEPINICIFRICHRITCGFFLALNRKLYHMLRQDKTAQKAKVPLHDKTSTTDWRTEKYRKKSIS